MAWILLIIAGLLEACWAVGLKFTDGFTRPIPSVLTVAGITTSMVLLSLATREIPIGTAYVAWVGIGALGASLLGMFLFDEPRHALRFLFLGLLVVAVIGLKATCR